MNPYLMGGSSISWVDLQLPFPEIVTSRDSGAEPNIINIHTWDEIETLHPKMLPSKILSKLATAQGSNLTNYEKIQLVLVPTQKMVPNKLLNKLSTQIFHITDLNTISLEYHFLLSIFPLLLS